MRWLCWSPALLTMYSSFHTSPGPLLPDLVHHSLTCLPLLSLLMFWTCSYLDKQFDYVQEQSSRILPVVTPPVEGTLFLYCLKTCCQQHPVPAAAGDQITPCHVRVASNEESRERDTIIRHQVLAHIQNLHLHPPLSTRGRRWGECLLCFYFHGWLSYNGSKEAWHSKYHIQEIVCF